MDFNFFPVGKIWNKDKKCWVKVSQDSLSHKKNFVYLDDTKFKDVDGVEIVEGHIVRVEEARQYEIYDVVNIQYYEVEKGLTLPHRYLGYSKSWLERELYQVKVVGHVLESPHFFDEQEERLKRIRTSICQQLKGKVWLPNTIKPIDDFLKAREEARGENLL